MKLRKAYLQRWYEYERGWGSKLDHYTIHASLTQYNAYVQGHWSKYPSSEAPDYYIAPAGREPVEVWVSEERYSELKRVDGKMYSELESIGVVDLSTVSEIEIPHKK